MLGGDAPQYDLPSKEPKYFKDKNSFNIDSIKNCSENFNKELLMLLSSPNITSKRYVYNQYDSTVRTNTVIGPGSDSAVIRLKDTDKALAISTDCNGKYVYLNPSVGTKMAVAESARNVVCSGAQPLAITNCLNFGNPQDPEIYWQFKESIFGMGEMCRELNTPVTGGNVSFYNETKEAAVYPSPVIGMVGLIEDLNMVTTMEYKNKNDFIVVLGSLNGQIGGSEYLKILHNKIEGPIANINMDLEEKIQEVCLECIDEKIINSLADIQKWSNNFVKLLLILSPDFNVIFHININWQRHSDCLIYNLSILSGEIVLTFQPKSLCICKLLCLFLIYSSRNSNASTVANIPIYRPFSLEVFGNIAPLYRDCWEYVCPC